MKGSKGQRFSDREPEDHALARQLDLASLKKMLESMPPAKRTEIVAIMGARAFSMQDILNEVQQETAHGEMFRTIIRKAQLARLKGKRQ
jgi:hypothetical protein